ncbi:phospholipase D-like domain-containing protein [Gracilibacillus salinarum]|uniref:Phospholipase D-like domain-containing protein n=1 Tax=Gracilibacillus salinarum TaxID=2932255 RepID=A0ABY4GT88_9BACI|nr:phospholipase D-like domain-containing protein [Gracilibacillus salinarum]UOQ87474.1 phospholipase D-like domain-containing protein [Gracilibacillus salinarum]
MKWGIDMLWIFLIIILLLLIWIDFLIGNYLVSIHNKSQHIRSRADKVDVFTTGDALFDAMLTDIENARHSIDIQFFIIRNDRISNQFYSLLANKQADGVQVRFMADWAGSIAFRSKWVSDKFPFLKTNKPRIPLFYRIQQRNHRKLMIIDEQISYIGGFNLGDDYLGKNIELGNWRDYHLRLEGEISEVFQQCFAIDWGEKIEQKRTHDGDLQILSTEGNVLEKEIVRFIKESSESIEIGSPYFIPTKKMELALHHAIKRGVKITILFPDKADHILTKAAALPYLEKMQHAGASIYLYTDGFFHGKVLFFDGKMCDFGTANFDRRSVELNQEINIIATNSHPLYDKMRTAFDADIQSSKKMSEHWIKHQPMYLKLLAKVVVPIRKLL